MSVIIIIITTNKENALYASFLFLLSVHTDQVKQRT
jgi:hypothetical protein